MAGRLLRIGFSLLGLAMAALVILIVAGLSWIVLTGEMLPVRDWLWIRMVAAWLLAIFLGIVALMAAHFSET